MSEKSELTRNSASRAICPKIADDLQTWEFFPASSNREAVFLVGSLQLDRYITVPQAKLSIITKMLSFFDGTHTIEDIEEHFVQSERKRVDVTGFYKTISETGLITSPTPNKIRNGDIEAFSIKLLGINVQPLFALLGRVTRIFFPVGFAATIVVVAIGFWALLSRPEMVLAYLRARYEATFFSTVDTVQYLVLMCLSFMLHEGAHGFVAAHYKLFAKRFEIALYLGFIPIVYLRIGGLYTLPPRKRVKVWIAGIYWNLVLASSCMVVLRFFALSSAAGHVTAIVAFANYSLALVNLFPFLPTDGYFLLSTALRRHNVRSRAWQEFANLIRFRPHNFSGLSALYMACTLLIIGTTLYQNFAWLRQGFDWRSPLSALRLGLPVLFMGMLVVRIFRSSGSSGSKYLSD